MTKTIGMDGKKRETSKKPTQKNKGGRPRKDRFLSSAAIDPLQAILICGWPARRRKRLQNGWGLTKQPLVAFLRKLCKKSILTSCIFSAILNRTNPRKATAQSGERATKSDRGRPKEKTSHDVTTLLAPKLSDIGIRAERKCGEMLKATAQRGERVVGRCDAKKFHDETSKSIELIDIGIEKNQSHRYQKLATIPKKSLNPRCHRCPTITCFRTPSRPHVITRDPAVPVDRETQPQTDHAETGDLDVFRRCGTDPIGMQYC